MNSTTTNTTNHTAEEEQLEENVGVAMQVIVITNSIAMTATAIASLSPPQGLWLSINHQQMTLLLLLTKAYFPQKVIEFLRGIKFVSMSFSFIKFESLPPFKQLIDWISFGLKTPELTNYDIKYG